MRYKQSFLLALGFCGHLNPSIVLLFISLRLLHLCRLLTLLGNTLLRFFVLLAFSISLWLFFGLLSLYLLLSSIQYNWLSFLMFNLMFSFMLGLVLSLVLMLFVLSVFLVLFGLLLILGCLLLVFGLISIGFTLMEFPSLVMGLVFSGSSCEILPGVGVVKLAGDVADAGPILDYFLVLATQLDIEASRQDLAVVAGADEVDGIDFHFEDHFKGSGVVVLDLNKVELGEGLLDILLGGIEVTLDEVEGDMLDIIVEFLNLVDQLVSLGIAEMLLLMIPVHRNHSNYNYQIKSIHILIPLPCPSLLILSSLL